MFRIGNSRANSFKNMLGCSVMFVFFELWKVAICECLRETIMSNVS